MTLWVACGATEWDFSSLLERRSSTIQDLLHEANKVFEAEESGEYALFPLEEQHPLSPRTLLISLLPADGDDPEIQLNYHKKSQVSPSLFPSPLRPRPSCPRPLRPLTGSGTLRRAASQTVIEDDRELIYIDPREGKSPLGLRQVLASWLSHKSDRAHPIPVISFLGRTGVGKSMLISSLLKDNEGSPPIRTHGQNGSTSANICIYPSGRALSEESEDRPRIYLDYEGEGGSDVPVELQSEREDRSGEDCTRREAVRQWFPRLAYIISDVIVFCATEEMSCDYSVYEWCLDTAKRANELLLDTDRPALIIVHNKYFVDNLSQDHMDTIHSTEEFLSIFDQEGTLASYFSSVQVVRVPLLTELHDSPLLHRLWDRQILRLDEAISGVSGERAQGRYESGFQLTEMAWFHVLPRVVEDCGRMNRLSVAQYLLHLQREQLGHQWGSACALFNALYYSSVSSSDTNSVDWFMGCATIAMDSLARGWATAQQEKGLLFDHHALESVDVLDNFLTFLDQNKTCTATAYLGTRKQHYQCQQSKALHDHHRSVSKSSKLTMMLRNVLKRGGSTRIWEGPFECEWDSEELAQQLRDRFVRIANAFIRQDVDEVSYHMDEIFNGVNYQSIWGRLPSNPSQTNWDPAIRNWAVDLMLYCLRYNQNIHCVDFWTLAGENWKYLYALCCYLPTSSVKIGKKKLGKGAFGSVYEATYMNREGRRMPCVAKIISGSSEAFHLIGLRQEIMINGVIHGPRLLKFFGFYYQGSDDTYVLVQERMDIDLHSWIDSTPKASLSQRIQLAADIAEGLAILHSYNLIHRDITPSNILLHEDEGLYRAYVGDLGIARRAADDAMTMLAPDAQYSAPELNSSKVGQCYYTESVDVYSFGRVLQRLFCVDQVSPDHMEQIEFLVSECTHFHPDRRPPMVAVWNALRKFDF